MSRNANADLSDATCLPPQFEANGAPKEIDAGGNKFVAEKHLDMPSGEDGRYRQVRPRP